jgi:UDPglucose--hexose-1-phosphate uridylyltransferase
MSEFRKDPITGRQVIVAPHRAQRPRELGVTNNRSPAAPCPFCAGNEALTPPEIWAMRKAPTQPNNPRWSVRVVPNKYPALIQSNPWSRNSDSFYDSQNGVGAHEVIVESPDHVTSLSALGVEQLTDVMGAYHQRMGALRSDPDFRYLLLYKNQGDRAGATLEHIHSQLIALPFVPAEAASELSGADTHYKLTGRCIYCEIIERERREGTRLVLDHEMFIAFCPYAPRFAYETWLIPKIHAAIFEESTQRDLPAFGRALHDTLARIDKALDDPPFNYFIHSLPTALTASPHYHWHLEILPQLSRAAGFELGSGAYINSVAPEDAARLLRDALL